jgi:hypothetical protein
MSRNLSPAQLAASQGRHYQVAPLAEFHLDEGTLLFTLAPFNIVVGSDTYLSTGGLGSIREVSEAADATEGLEFSLSGIDEALVTIAAAASYEGRLVRLLKAYLDAETNAIIGSPVVQWIGRIRTMAIVESNDSAAITLTAEHYEIELQQASPLRWNNADQQKLYPGDKGCEHVEALVERRLIWPSREALKR